MYIWICLFILSCFFIQIHIKYLIFSNELFFNNLLHIYYSLICNLLNYYKLIKLIINDYEL